MKTLIISLVVMLSLSGCVGLAATLLGDANALHQAGRDYVLENHDLRRFIRAECKASLVRQIEALRNDGDEAALREMLAKNYPDLVSIDLFKRFENGDDTTIAMGCD